MFYVLIVFHYFVGRRLRETIVFKLKVFFSEYEVFFTLKCKSLTNSYANPSFKQALAISVQLRDKNIMTSLTIIQEAYLRNGMILTNLPLHTLYPIVISYPTVASGINTKTAAKILMMMMPSITLSWSIGHRRKNIIGAFMYNCRARYNCMILLIYHNY